MPPSGPSLWSSNNSVRVRDANDNDSGGGIATMNNHHHGGGGMEEHDVIGSLGKALSSVNIVTGGGEVDASGRGGVAHPQQGYGAPGTALGANTASWVGLSGGGAAVAPAPAGLSYNYYGNNSNGHGQQPPAHVKAAAAAAAAASHTEHHDSLQNILYDSGIYEKEEVARRRASSGGSVHSHGHGGGGGRVRPTTPTPLPHDRERKPSIDVFLSQSPSKALGEAAFGVMHRPVSNPSLNLYHGGHDGSAAGSGNAGPKPPASTAPSSRSESPQAASRGGVGSPYGAAGGGMYHPSQFANGGFAPAGGNQHVGAGLQADLQPRPSLPGQFPGAVANGQGNVHGGQQAPQVQQQHAQQQSQYIPVPVSQQQQPQVFYMAVPAPDGKGQVLQPVQMVQMPGQPGALMMPVAPGGGSRTGGGDQGVGQAGQPVMLMQPVPGGAGMGGAAAGMYGGDGGGGGQYPQYGGAGQGGYDGGGAGRYQPKGGGAEGPGHGGAGPYPDGAGRSDSFDPAGGGAAGNGNGGSLSVLYSSPQRPPLRALLGNVRRLSRDQVGCRLLQQALDEDGPSAATAILNEGLTFWAEAMVDPFGNYLFQKILERITPEERVTLVSSVSTRLVNASLNLHGTRSVQKIVEVCAVDEEESEEEEGSQESKSEEESKKEEDQDEYSRNAGGARPRRSKKKRDTAARILTDALRPSAARLCIDSHGNHAIQRILLKLPYQYAQFIFDAVAASVEDVARHRHGCCVIQRCLDSRHSAARTHLVGRIVEKGLELMQDAYGNYVVQYVLDVCGDDEVHAICESVVGKVCPLAIQKFSSNVMEKCLERCTDRVREAYLDELNDSDRIRELMMDPFGNYVVQRALSVSTHAQAIRLVETMKPHLSSQDGGGIRNTAGGRRILGKICRRFPNFALEGETFEDYDLSQVLARGSPGHHHGSHGGGGRRRDQFGAPPHQGGPSPNHRRNGRGGRNHHQHHQQQQHNTQQQQQQHNTQQQQQQQHNTIPQYQPPQQQVGQQVGHHVNVQPSDMNVMPSYGANPYLFPHSMQ